MSDALGEFLLQVVRDSAAELAGIVFILIAVGLPLALAGYLLFRRMAARHNVNVSFDWQGADIPPESASTRPRRHDPSPADAFEPRQYLVMVYNVLTLIAALTLLGGAIAAWWVATPGNGLLLVALILAVLALIGFLSIGKYDRQQRRAEEWRGAWDDLASKINVVTSHADPDVHVMDGKAVATARRMAADGASLDDICRATERKFSSWDEPRREAFRRVMQAMLAAR